MRISQNNKQSNIYDVLILISFGLMIFGIIGYIICDVIESIGI